GASPHEEDTWLGRGVRAGNAVLRVKMRDSRCAVTTHSPETGELDMNTLKIIASYRTDQPKEVNFGVYCTVAEPGEAAVGDEVVPITS
ncbi:MAG: MOSC domain-containing protein, partial [Dehalococcoidia bacterium]|nr:MOSC domain-containing protein [Dehalococcoidia bacterium]